MFDVVVPKIESTVSAGNYGRFTIEPLESGFGITLGNALRRVLLSTLPGCAVTTVKIDQVYHEFSSIPHVKEDTTQFLLNVKQIRLRALSDRPVKMHLDVRGERVVYARDIEVPLDVEIVNPDLYLATLDSEEARLAVEFGVEQGKGYVPSDNREGLPIGVIPVDAIFTPIRKVNYTVEHTRVGQVTDYDRLILDVWTDGTILPQEALRRSAAILMSYLQLIVDMGKAPARGEMKPFAALGIAPRDYERPIEELDLSVRAFNCLKRAGLTKIGQVLEMTEDELMEVRNFGRKSLEELRDKLAARGFTLRSRSGASVAASEGKAESGDAYSEAGLASGEEAAVLDSLRGFQGQIIEVELSESDLAPDTEKE